MHESGRNPQKLGKILVMNYNENNLRFVKSAQKIA